MAGIAGHVNQEAVDSVISLEDYRDRKGAGKKTDALTEHKKTIRCILDRACHYFAAAEKMYDSLSSIYESSINYNELYRIAAKIIKEEFAQKKISSSPGTVRKYFAGTAAPFGFENDLNALLDGCQRVYLIHAPVGAGSEKILNIFLESAVYRGFTTEGYYCPMKPATKLEHLIIPGLGLGFITSNQYHTLGKSAIKAEVIPVDLNKIFYCDSIKKQEGLLRNSRKKMDELLEKGIFCLRQANKEQANVLNS